MLEYLRNVSEKPFAKVLIALLAFSFVGWGVAEWVLGGSVRDTTLVSVGGAPISIQEYSNTRTNAMNSMDRSELYALNTDKEKSAAFSAQILSQLTTQQMVQNRANDLGFVVSDKKIADEIKNFPEFQSNGKFSNAMYEMLLMRAGLTTEQFAAFLRNQIVRSMTLGSVSVPLNIPQFVVDAAYNARYATRSIEYATVKLSDFKAVKPTEEQLKNFYTINPRVVPEMRSVSYIFISGDMSKPDISDKTHAAAEKVEDDIFAGESLESVAKKHKVKYVSLKPFAQSEKIKDEIIDDKMIAQIFDMAEGEDSELIETPKGLLLVHVDKVIPTHNAEFDSVKKSLVADWQNDERTKQAYVRANELLVDLNKGGKLSGAKSVTVSRTSGAPISVLSGAFNSAIGTNTIIPDKDAFYVLSVKSEIMPKQDTKKLNDLRKELQQSEMRQIQDDYNSFLVRKYPVKVNKKVYNRFFEK